MIEYLDEAMRLLVLIMPKMSGCVKTNKVKDGDKDKNNKLVPFERDDEKLLEKYKDVWTKIEDLKNIKLNMLPVYDDRYIKKKGYKVIKFILTFATSMRQKVIQNVNPLQSFLLILYLFIKTNITYKYIRQLCL